MGLTDIIQPEEIRALWSDHIQTEVKIMKQVGLSKEQIARYEKDGILVVEDFLTPDEVESMRRGCWQLVEDMDPSVHKGVFSGTSTKNDKQVTFLLS